MEEEKKKATKPEILYYLCMGGGVVGDEMGIYTLQYVEMCDKYIDKDSTLYHVVGWKEDGGDDQPVTLTKEDKEEVTGNFFGAMFGKAFSPGYFIREEKSLGVPPRLFRDGKAAFYALIALYKEVRDACDKEIARLEGMDD